MIKELRIQNYKSVVDLTLELGKTNVFIGENGSGKTNVLEAIAMMSGAMNSRLTPQDLSNVGVRVAKPSLTLSSFSKNGIENGKSINYNILFQDKKNEIISFTTTIINEKRDDLFSDWTITKSDLDKLAADVIQKYRLDKLLDLSLDVSFSKYLKSNMPPRIFELKQFANYLNGFLIYDLNSQALRGVTSQSLMSPLGIHGEGLDRALASFKKRELNKLLKYKYLISWLDKIVIDANDELRLSNFRAKGNSLLYFSDKFMKKNAFFNIENANEGVLHILFYLTLFIHKDAPKFFAIDNIETALNPLLCREIMKVISNLNKDKQVLITTHNPAILDGLDLTNDDIRLFEVKRNNKGYTVAQRIQFKKGAEKKFKLSEMWMKGMLGAIPTNF